VNNIFQYATGFYSTAKNVNPVLKGGFEKAETTLQWASSHPTILKIEKPILAYVDVFGNNQLDKIEYGLEKSKEALSVEKVKDIGWNLAKGGKEYLGNTVARSTEVIQEKIIGPGKDVVNAQIQNGKEKLSHTLEENKEKISSCLSKKSMSLLENAEELVDKYLPEEEVEEGSETQPKESSVFPRFKQDAKSVSNRLYSKISKIFKDTPIIRRTPEAVSTLQSYSVNLIDYASQYIPKDLPEKFANSPFVEKVVNKINLIREEPFVKKQEKFLISGTNSFMGLLPESLSCLINRSFDSLRTTLRQSFYPRSLTTSTEDYQESYDSPNHSESLSKSFDQFNDHEGNEEDKEEEQEEDTGDLNTHEEQKEQGEVLNEDEEEEEEEVNVDRDE
jgi:hypothetical protein